jgi:signal transduction histidine kinase
VTVVERGHVVVMGDRQRLTQGMMNLIRNSLEHAPATPIEVGSRLVDDNVRLWVSDRGPGIAPGDQERLFERFARGSDRRRGSAGAGLGLAIVKAVAEGHRGRVEVDSVVGRGTTITIVIPVERASTLEPVG